MHGNSEGQSAASSSYDGKVVGEPTEPCRKAPELQSSPSAMSVEANLVLSTESAMGSQVPDVEPDGRFGRVKTSKTTPREACMSCGVALFQVKSRIEGGRLLIANSSYLYQRR